MRKIKILVFILSWLSLQDSTAMISMNLDFCKLVINNIERTISFRIHHFIENLINNRVTSTSHLVFATPDSLDAQHTAEAICKKVNGTFIHINIYDYYDSIEKIFKHIDERIAHNNLNIIFLQHVDVLLDREKISSDFLRMLNAYRYEKNIKIIIHVHDQKDTVGKFENYFDYPISLGVPEKDERKQILSYHFNKNSICISTSLLNQIIKYTDKYMWSEVDTIASNLALEAQKNNQSITYDLARKHIIPLFSPYEEFLLYSKNSLKKLMQMLKSPRGMLTICSIGHFFIHYKRHQYVKRLEKELKKQRKLC